MSTSWSAKSLKATPVAADELMIIDSADANPSTQNKRITIGSIPASEVFTWTADHNADGFDLLNVGGIQINNPLDTFQYIVTPNSITSDIITNLPLLINDDTFVFENFTQTLTNKTIDDFGNSVAADRNHVQVRNETGGILQKGEVVYVSGFDVAEDLSEVSRADASSDATMPAIGIVTDNILNFTNGSVTISGISEGVITTGLAVGDTLYVSETPGEFTNVKPTGTALIQNIGEVLKVGGLGVGIIKVTSIDKANDLPNLPSANFWLGNATGVAAAVTMSNDATMDNAGLLTISNNAVTDAKTATFTTTKISTLSKSLLSTAIVFNDQNNVLGAFYQDLAEITTPVDPAAGTRRVFVDDTTGEISVRTSSSETISLESPNPTTSDIVLGTLDAPNSQYIDTGHNWAGNNNGSQTLGITLGTTEPVGITYTFTYTVTASDLPTPMTGLVYNRHAFMITGQVINNDAVASIVAVKVFINDVEIDVGGASSSISAGNFGRWFGYDAQATAVVNDVIQVKLWTNGSVLVNLEKFGVYLFPSEIEATAQSLTTNINGFNNTEFIADNPVGVTLASTLQTVFPEYNVTGQDGWFQGYYGQGTPRILFGEIAVPDQLDERVGMNNDAANRMSLPAIQYIHRYRVTI